MIPQIQEIEDSLATIVLIEVATTCLSPDHIIVCEKLGRLRPSGERVRDSASLVMVQTANNPPMTLARLVSRIAEDLCKAGHSHCSPRSEFRLVLAAKVLAMAVALRSKDGNLIDVINSIVSKTSPTRIRQWAILMKAATGPERYCFGDFAYGEVDMEKLRSSCELAGSDYFELYRRECVGKLSIMRDASGPNSIDVNAIRPPCEVSPSTSRQMYRIADDYFGNLAETEQRQFLADLDRQQAIFGVVGLGTIPAEFLRRMDSFTQWITVFERIERGHGWVVPNHTHFIIASTEPKALSQGNRDIVSALELGDWGQRPLDSSIQAFCQYIGTAQEHERQGHVEEALLHLVFGLDLLLGGKADESLTVILAERVGILLSVAQRT